MALEEADAQYDPYAEWQDLQQDDTAQQSTGPTGNAISSENVHPAPTTEPTSSAGWDQQLWDG